MYRRELLILTSLAVVAAILVGLSTALFVKRLNTAVASVVSVTIPDFVSTGGLMQRLLENWTRVLMIENARTSEERENLIQKVEGNTTDRFLKAFRETPTAPEQQVYLDQLFLDRAQFVELRGTYFQLIRNGKLEAATEYFHSVLTPAFEKYRSRAEKLFQITAKIGNERAKKVELVSRQAILVSAGLSVLVFFAGIVVGFRTIFEGLTFVHRLRRPFAFSKS